MRRQRTMGRAAAGAVLLTGAALSAGLLGAYARAAAPAEAPGPARPPAEHHDLLKRLGVPLPPGAGATPHGRPAAVPPVPVAVFNFGMKSDTPERKWLEKGLADRVITDMYRVESVTVVQRDIMQEAAERTRWARCRRAGTPCGSMRPTRRGPGESL